MSSQYIVKMKVGDDIGPLLGTCKSRVCSAVCPALAQLTDRDPHLPGPASPRLSVTQAPVICAATARPVLTNHSRAGQSPRISNKLHGTRACHEGSHQSIKCVGDFNACVTLIIPGKMTLESRKPGK